MADIAVVLSDPVLTGDTLVYRVEVLDGPESGSGAHSALFIDAFVKKALKREAGRAKRLRGKARDGVSGIRGRLGGGDEDLPREPGGHGGDRDLPREPGPGARRGRGGEREIRRGGRGREPEIR